MLQVALLLLGALVVFQTCESVRIDVPVNLDCIVVNNVLRCKQAVDPDYCREKWDFPNPCTRNRGKLTRFVYPGDETKFLMCDRTDKLYVVQCPQYHRFHRRCRQCVVRGTRLSDTCELLFPRPTPLPADKTAATVIA